MEPVNRGGAQIIPRPDIWRPGAPAPWAHLAPADRQPTLAEVRAAFATAPSPKPWTGPIRDGRRTSAVLAALYAHEAADGSAGLAEVLLTRRSQNLRAHRGEVSFPGGRSEPEDPDAVATALREAHEEVNLDVGHPGGIEIIGELDHLATFSSGASIIPVVGVLPAPPTDLVAEPAEVDAILHVTLAELADPAYYREEIWRFPDGRDRSITFYELMGDTVWGATARMLRQLLALVLGVDAGPGPEAGSLTP